MKTREHAGITTVRFDLVTRSFGRERWGNDIAGDAFLLEEARQHEATGPGFVTNPQFFVWMAQLAHELFDAVKGVGDLSIVPDFSVTPCFGDGDGNIFGMDIEAQIQYFFVHICGVLVAHYLVRPAGTPCPSPNMRIGPELAEGQPAIPMRPAHHAFFNQTCCASNLLAQIGPQP
jgi:hypothetical protein